MRLPSIQTAFAALAIAALACGFAAMPVRAQATLPDGFRDSLVIGGLDFPVGMTFLPDGRLLVIEQFSRRLRAVRAGALTTPDPVATLPSIETGGEQGLLGIAVDPGWPARPYLYFHMDDLGSSTIRVTRYTAGGDLTGAGSGNLTVDTGTRRDILTGIPDQAGNHNGGTVRFGPDGMLYVSLGEDAARCVAQDTLTLRGVILRLDVSAIPAGGGSAPSVASLAAAGNPLLNHVDPRSRLIWAWGLRNPFRFQIDPANGALFIGDVGQSVYEEIDRAAAGGLDFGWPRFEATRLEESGCVLTATHTTPIHFYDRTGSSAAVISGGVYRTPSAGNCDHCFPAAYEGDFFFSDYYTGFLRRLKGSGNSWSIAPAVSGQPTSTTWATGFDNVSDYAIGPGGGLWYCNQGSGEIRAILGGVDDTTTTPPPTPAPLVTFARPYPQPAPGSVNLSFRLENGAQTRIRIYDLRGALVRTLVNANRPAGTTVESWDGRDDDGERVTAGLYVARLEAAGQTVQHRIMLLQ